MNPFFSVVIPTYNRRNLLFRAFESVLSQTYKNFEVLIIDDGSTDDTAEFVRPLLCQNVRYFYQENRGISSARNSGIRNSLGDWIAFLDSDDEWAAHKLALQAEFILKNKNIKIVHSNEIWIRNSKRVNQKNTYKKSGGNIFKDCLCLCLIGPSTVVIKKELLEEYNNFDERFKVCEDYHLWLKITNHYEIGFLTEDLIYKYGGHEDQLSSRYFAMDLWRVYAMVDVLMNQHLSSTNREDLIDVLNQKLEILKIGSIKNNHLWLKQEVERIQSLFKEKENLIQKHEWWTPINHSEDFPLAILSRN